MELRFTIPTTGYKNIVLEYVLESSSTTSGDSTELFDYSVDGGTTWKSAGMTVNGATADTLDTTPSVYQGTSWGLVTITFGSDASVNNNSALVFRIKFKGNSSKASGNNRFDNVTVEGDASADVAVQQNAARFSLSPNPATSKVILASWDGPKSISIVDVAGRVVAATSLAFALVLAFAPSLLLHPTPNVPINKMLKPINIFLPTAATS